MVTWRRQYWSLPFSCRLPLRPPGYWAGKLNVVISYLVKWEMKLLIHSQTSKGWWYQQGWGGGFASRIFLIYDYHDIQNHQGLYSPSGKTSYCQISWNLEALRFVAIMIVSRGYRGACHISERLVKSKPESRCFEISRDLAVRPSVLRMKPRWLRCSCADAIQLP